MYRTGTDTGIVLPGELKKNWIKIYTKNQYVEETYEFPYLYQCCTQ
jgi:hypothetical protein